VIAAGSLLGTYLAKPVSYPVGKVNLMNIYSLTFEEYLKNDAITNIPLYFVGKMFALVSGM
jgi:predicted AAA+ superfamily ATPase